MGTYDATAGEGRPAARPSVLLFFSVLLFLPVGEGLLGKSSSADPTPNTDPSFGSWNWDLRQSEPPLPLIRARILAPDAPDFWPTFIVWSGIAPVSGGGAVPIPVLDEPTDTD